MPPTPLAPEGEGWLGRLKAYWTDGETWRGLAYLLVRFPVGLATFCVAVTAALSAIAAPVVAPLAPFDLGFWHPDSVLDGLALVPFGLIALVAAGWISEGLAAISRALIGWVSREPSRWLFDAP